jgi:hypothetical protein
METLDNYCIADSHFDVLGAETLLVERTEEEEELEGAERIKKKSL